MPRVPFERAFDLEPIYRLQAKDAPEVFSVPPLTLGRFMALMDADWNGIARRIVGSLRPPVGDVKAPRTPTQAISRDLAQVDHGAFAGLACAVIPGMTERWWLKHGNVIEALCLVSAFAHAHDWDFIGRAVAFGEAPKPQEVMATRQTVNAALMTFCRVFTFYSPDQLLAMRVEGFFYLKEGAIEAMRAARDEDDDSAPPLAAFDAMPTVKDTEHRSPLWAAIDEADRKKAN